MKKRDVFLPALTTLVIATFFVFLSCASNERIDDDGEDDLAASEESISSDGTSDTLAAEADAPAKLEEGTKTEGELAQAPNQDGMGLEATTQGEAAAADPLAQNPDASLEASIADKDAAKANADLGNPVTAEADPNAGLPTGDQLAGAELAAAPAPAPEPAPLPEPAPSIQGEAETKPVVRRHRRADHSGVPHIPGAAIRRGKALLNRFYFVRSGDTTASVSQLIYGSESRAKDLSFWNGHTQSWKPGRVIYYSSPSQPDDRKMRAFFEERGVPSEEYVVKPSDWMSKIAQMKLGDARSWKEIAVLNGLDKPALEVGQKLIVFPKNLSGYSQDQGASAPPPQQQARKEPEAVKPPVEAPQVPTQTAPPAPPTVAAPAVPPPVESPVARVAEKNGLDWKNLIDQNAWAGLFVAVALLLIIALVSINKKKKSKRDESSDDGFSPKVKRR